MLWDGLDTSFEDNLLDVWMVGGETPKFVSIFLHFEISAYSSSVDGIIFYKILLRRFCVLRQLWG